MLKLLLVLIAVIIVLVVIWIRYVEVLRVVGRSMLPTLKDRDLVVILKCHYKIAVHDVVCVYDKNGKILIKRVSGISESSIFVLGDNALESRDSRDFGWLSKRNIIGKVIVPTTILPRSLQKTI